MNHVYLSNASIVLGIIAILTCLLGDVPEPFSTITIVIIPMILIVNYYTLMELEYYKLS